MVYYLGFGFNLQIELEVEIIVFLFKEVEYKVEFKILCEIKIWILNYDFEYLLIQGI